MKDSFVLNCRLFLKRGSGVCLENATMIQIRDMFQNGKPDIVLKTVNRFNVKRTPISFDLKSSLKWGIVVFVMFNKCCL